MSNIEIDISNMSIEQITDEIHQRFLADLYECFKEVFYDLGMNKQKDYAYKLFDILYFNYKEEDDLWGTDVMPEYKLMVKDDTYSELKIEKTIEEFKKENDNGLKPLRYQ